MNNYIFGAHFDEIWRFDLRTYNWRKVQPRAGVAPPKRALHTAVEIASSMYIYGGLGLADTWRYDFQTKEWTMLADAPAEGDTNHPGKRHAHAAAAVSDGFYVFGGNSHVKGSKPINWNDVWKFSLGTNTWRLVPAANPAGSGTPSIVPGARGHHSLVALSHSTLLLYGGALCTPGCKCYGDSWLFDTASASWQQLNATDAPIHRYRQTLLLDRTSGDLYLFGGESYKPYMYHNAVDRLRVQLPQPPPRLVEAPDRAVADGPGTPMGSLGGAPSAAATAAMAAGVANGAPLARQRPQHSKHAEQGPQKSSRWFAPGGACAHLTGPAPLPPSPLRADGTSGPRLRGDEERPRARWGRGVSTIGVRVRMWDGGGVQGCSDPRASFAFASSFRSGLTLGRLLRI